MDLFKFSQKNIRKSVGGAKYKSLRTLCLAGIMLLAFYSVINFPGYYAQGPDTQQWIMIYLCLLSAIILLYITLASSSWEGKAPHDWHSSGGSMHAFTFGSLFCKKCGAKRVLAGIGKNSKPLFITPGLAAPEGVNIRFYCPYCSNAVSEAECEKREFRFSKLKATDVAELGKDFKKTHRAYRLSKEYTRRYMLVTLILLFLEISAVNFARSEAVRLLLPLALGYFLFVSAKNMLTALVSRYYVTEKGLVQRTLWGYSLYALNRKSSFIKFNDSSNSTAWGLFTEKENILISSIILEHNELIAQLQDKCRENSVPIIK